MNPVLLGLALFSSLLSINFFVYSAVERSLTYFLFGVADAVMAAVCLGVGLP